MPSSYRVHAVAMMQTKTTSFAFLLLDRLAKGFIGCKINFT
jgi:hypothetical protein